MRHIKKSVISLLMVLALTFSTVEVLPTSENVINVEAASKTKINKNKATLIKGQTINLKISGTKSKVKWSSSKPKVASVNSKGKVTAKKKGTTTITAKVNTKKYTCKITVQTPSLSTKSIKLTVGGSTTLKLKGTNQKIKWRSSEKNVATVTSSGKVTAKKAGTTTITATVLKKTYKCIVTVENVPSQPSDSKSDNTSANDNTTTEDTNATDSSDNSSVTNYSSVYTSATGSKYHSIPNCGNMNPNNTKEMTEQEAINKGCSKCSKCF